MELDVDHFMKRFPAGPQLIDPFERVYTQASDADSGRRTILKQYLTKQPELTEAVLENLQSHEALRAFEGLCHIQAFCRVADEIIVAFDYHSENLQEWLETPNCGNIGSILRVAEGVLEAIASLNSSGINLIDDINLTTVVLEGESVRILYDQRVKNFSGTFLSKDFFWSVDKINAEVFEANPFSGDLNSEAVFQLGLMLLHLIDSTHKLTGKGRTIETSKHNNQNIPKLNKYQVTDNKASLNLDYIDAIVNNVLAEDNYIQRQLVGLIIKMLAKSQERIPFEEVVVEIELLTKKYRDSTRTIKRPSNKLIKPPINIEFEQFKPNTFEQQVSAIQQIIQSPHSQADRKSSEPAQTQALNSFDQWPKTEELIFGSLCQESPFSATEVPMGFSSKGEFNNRQQPPIKYHTARNVQNIPRFSIDQRLEFRSESSFQAESEKDSQGMNSFNDFASVNNLMQESNLGKLILQIQYHPSILQLCNKTLQELEKSRVASYRRYQNGSQYFGQTINGQKRQGLGIYTTEGGQIYFGVWTANSLSQGVFCFKNGESFQGKIEKGKSGWGRYRYSNGSVYEGNWTKDLKDGEGSMVYPNRDRYEGSWAAGKKHGAGVYYYSNGIIYRGGFIKGKKNGFGQLIFPNGTKIQGSWENTQLNGRGRVWYQNGDQYIGQFSQSSKQGAGRFSWSDGTYDGQFRHDALQGSAKVVFVDGEQYEGQIKNGRKHGQGVYVYKNGDKFDGMWVDDRKVEGKYYFSDGSLFSGRLEGNEPFQGRMVYPNKDSFEGAFLRGMRHGKGIYTSKSQGKHFNGEWDSDQLIRQL